MPQQNKKQNKLKKILGLFNPKTLKGGIALFALVFAIGGGVYFVYRSFAATGPASIMYQDYTRISSTSRSVTVVNDSAAMPGNQKVALITPGGILNYDPPTLRTAQKTCYVLRVPGDGFGGGKATTVELGAYGNKKRVTISPTKYYREYCVEPGTSDTFDGNVKNIAGDPVLVMHMSMYVSVPAKWQIISRAQGFACQPTSYSYSCTGTLTVQRPNKPDTRQTIAVNEDTFIMTSPNMKQNIDRLVSGQLPFDVEILSSNGTAITVEFYETQYK